MPSSELNGNGKPPLVVVLGPTAVGKTEIAIQLAERLNGEIISADSRLFYRGMDIGTAKPALEEQARIPHHLIDVADPEEIMSLAEFQRAARQAILAIHGRKRLPFLVGGTGQYIHAVIEAWQIPPTAPDSRLRQALEHWAAEIGPGGLHARLAVVDPLAAAQIDFRNLRRTVRALEVVFSTGKRFSELRQKGTSPYRLFLLGLTRPRKELYARVDARIEMMFDQGLLDEARSLLQQGYTPDLPTLSAIGYAEAIACLQGRMTLEQAKESMKRRTRQFVRRQANWFKLQDTGIHWFTAGVSGLDQMENEIRIWLSNY
jgi:tRNA dimethylallyltransferase